MPENNEHLAHLEGLFLFKENERVIEDVENNNGIIRINDDVLYIKAKFYGRILFVGENLKKMQIQSYSQYNYKFRIFADPEIVKLLEECWCCGRPRILINFGEGHGWKETCVGMKPLKLPCKYADEVECIGILDGNCKGRCDASKG